MCARECGMGEISSKVSQRQTAQVPTSHHPSDNIRTTDLFPSLQTLLHHLVPNWTVSAAAAEEELKCKIITLLTLLALHSSIVAWFSEGDVPHMKDSGHNLKHHGPVLCRDANHVHGLLHKQAGRETFCIIRTAMCAPTSSAVVSHVRMENKEKIVPSFPEIRSYRWCRPLCRNRTDWGRSSNPGWWFPGFSSVLHSLLQ